MRTKLIQTSLALFFIGYADEDNKLILERILISTSTGDSRLTIEYTQFILRSPKKIHYKFIFITIITI